MADLFFDYKRLKSLREASGKSINSLAREIALDPTYLSRLERGLHPNPAHLTVVLLAGALGADLAEMTTENNPEMQV